MQKISSCLWFDSNAEEAAKFYVSIFQNSKMGKIDLYPEGIQETTGKPAGSIMTVAFQLEGQDFMGLNGGSIFKLSPAVSYSVNCKDADEVNALWAKLSEGGKALMPLDKYPFSERYGWIEDKFGLSWQLNAAPRAQRITPSLMFVGEQAGRAEEAMNLYTSLFPDSGIMNIARYGDMGVEGEKPDAIAHAVFKLAGQEFIAMDSSGPHKFAFSEGTSLVVDCDDQQEVDMYWEKLIAGGGAESQCGWLKDKFGFNWQITPKRLNELLRDADTAKAQRVMMAMMGMRKIIVADLEKAYNGE